MREKYIEQKLVREVKKRGGLCEKWNSGSSGWPDRLRENLSKKLPKRVLRNEVLDLHTC